MQAAQGTGLRGWSKGCGKLVGVDIIDIALGRLSG